MRRQKTKLQFSAYVGRTGEEQKIDPEFMCPVTKTAHTKKRHEHGNSTELHCFVVVVVGAGPLLCLLIMNRTNHKSGRANEWSLC